MNTKSTPGGESRIRRAAIVTKRNHREAVHLAHELADWLLRRGIEVELDASIIRSRGMKGARPLAVGADRDLVVVLGGDGTLLSVARSYGEGTPILGVNLGSLGFLSEINRSELYPTLVEVLGGRFETVERSMFEVGLERTAGGSQTYRALNDVVINKSVLARMIFLTVRIDGLLVAEYRADGLIVSTPTGSTAYNLSAGGPIVHPTLPVAVLTPICPHTLSMRPLVVPDSSHIEVTLDTPQEAVYLTIDGQEGATLEHLDTVNITVSPQPVCLVRGGTLTYYESLREKLRWGE